MWQVLLIGGASAAGKTTLAEQIALEEGVEAVSLDPLSRGEAEHLLQRPEIWDGPGEVLRLLRKASQEFSPILEQLVYRTLNEGQRTVIEGERIRPDCAAEIVRQAGGLVACLFLVEEEPAAIRQNLEAKSRSFLLLDEARRRNVVKVDCDYGLWVEHEARALHLPVLRPRPWPTLWSRAQLELMRLAVEDAGLVVG